VCVCVCCIIKDYKEAARIRDSLKLFEEEEPVLRLRRLIKEAISDQRFQVRACVRASLLSL
jgi:ApaG protein